MSELDQLMNQIRTQIVAHGGGGISALGRKFHIADDNGDKKLDLKYELPKMLEEIKVKLTKDELTRVSTLLDRDGNGSINFEEFLFHLAPPMSQRRIEVVNEIFGKIDKNKSGHLTKEDIGTGNRAESSFKNLSNLFDQNGDGSISREEFINYYREISPSIDTDEYFETMMHNAWKV